jgi:hypothetical protein
LLQSPPASASDVKGTIEHFNKWKKDNKKEAGITAGVIEGVLYDAKGVEAIGKLPSKLELYAQIAGSIQVSSFLPVSFIITSPFSSSPPSPPRPRPLFPSLPRVLSP